MRKPLTASRALILTLGVLLLIWDVCSAQSPAPEPSRVVAIGDIHGDIQALRKAFQAAGATDKNDAWIGGKMTVVQLGDLVGGSDDEREVLDFIFEIQRRAAERGGAVHALIGDHEVLAARLDSHGVGANPFEDWQSVEELQIGDPRLRSLPLEERARAAALIPGGPYARQIAEFPAVIKIGDTVFVHAGVTPRWATYGTDRINGEVRDWLMGLTPEPESSQGADDGDGVMWTRQFSVDVKDDDCAALAESLSILGAQRMIVAHTVRQRITSRCGGRVWAIDVGLSRADGGRVQVLEVVDDRVLRVIDAPIPWLAISIFVAVFAIATLRNIHLGVLMLPAAVGVGVVVAGMPVTDILTGFPVHVMILIAGVTFFFGIAQANGTIDALIQRLIAAVGDRRALLPFLIFLITAGVASMGSSQAGYVMIPLAMAAAKRSAVDPMLMGVALNSGMSTGGFALTSLFGIVTLTQAYEAESDYNVRIGLEPFTLLTAAAIANLALLLVAAWLFPGRGGAVATRDSAIELPATAARSRLASHQVVTLICMVVLILTIVIGFALIYDPDPRSPNRTNATAATAVLGLIPFGLGAVLALRWPKAGVEGIRRIDWSTILMVGSIVMFVEVLQYINADRLLANAAQDFGTPLMHAFLICAIAGLVSAFASTTAIITLLVPLSVPLAVSGDVAGAGLMIALGVCASIVDASPFSTTGALILAAAGEGERPRLKSLLMRWGLSMVIVGPAAAVVVLALL